MMRWFRSRLFMLARCSAKRNGLKLLCPCTGLLPHCIHAKHIQMGRCHSLAECIQSGRHVPMSSTVPPTTQQFTLIWMPSPHNGTLHSPWIKRSSTEWQWRELSTVFWCIMHFELDCRQFNNSVVPWIRARADSGKPKTNRKSYKSHWNISLFECNEWMRGSQLTRKRRWECSLLYEVVVEPAIIWDLFSLQLHQYHADNPLETEWTFFSASCLNCCVRWVHHEGATHRRRKW